MLIALSEFCMLPLCCIDSCGNFKLPRRSKKRLTIKERNLWENIDNWRKSKNMPRESTIAAAREGDFGDLGIFVSSCNDAIETKDIAKFMEVLGKHIDSVYWVFGDGLAIVHAADRRICEYFASGNAEALATMNLPLELKEHVKDFRATNKLDDEAVCQFYLYFWICIESRLSQRSFQMIFAQNGKSLYNSFIKIIRTGIRKRKHKMWEIHKELGMDYKQFDDILRTPSRFCNRDFLKKFANAYYELCFTGGNEKPHDANVLYAVWNSVAHAVWIMDKAKEILHVDFRDLATKYYKDFAATASS